MGVMVHEVVHDLKCLHFRDLFTIQGFLEGIQEVKNSDWLSAAESATIHLVPAAAVSLAVVASDIRTRRRHRVVEPISLVVDDNGEMAVAWDDGRESWSWWTKVAVWPQNFGVKVGR